MIYTRFERNCGKFKRVHYLISFKVDMSNQSMIKTFLYLAVPAYQWPADIDQGPLPSQAPR